MRSKILIFSILETLLAVEDYLDDFVLETTPIMPAWTTEYYLEDTTTERVITVLDQMENIENHRSRFITLCDD